MRRLGHAMRGEKVYRCERQKGRNGGVRTHHDFGGAERQSTFYTNGSALRRVSDQIGSVYRSINSATFNPGATAEIIFAAWPRSGDLRGFGARLVKGGPAGRGWRQRSRVGRCVGGSSDWEA